MRKRALEHSSDDLPSKVGRLEFKYPYGNKKLRFSRVINYSIDSVKLLNKHEIKEAPYVYIKPNEEFLCIQASKEDNRLNLGDYLKPSPMDVALAYSKKSIFYICRKARREWQFFQFCEKHGWTYDDIIEYCRTNRTDIATVIKELKQIYWTLEKKCHVNVDKIIEQCSKDKKKVKLFFEYLTKYLHSLSARKPVVVLRKIESDPELKLLLKRKVQEILTPNQNESRNVNIETTDNTVYRDIKRLNRRGNYTRIREDLNVNKPFVAPYNLQQDTNKSSLTTGNKRIRKSVDSLNEAKNDAKEEILYIRTKINESEVDKNDSFNQSSILKSDKKSKQILGKKIIPQNTQDAENPDAEKTKSDSSAIQSTDLLKDLAVGINTGIEENVSSESNEVYAENNLLKKRGIIKDTEKNILLPFNLESEMKLIPIVKQTTKITDDTSSVEEETANESVDSSRNAERLEADTKKRESLLRSNTIYTKSDRLRIRSTIGTKVNETQNANGITLNLSSDGKSELSAIEKISEIFCDTNGAVHGDTSDEESRSSLIEAERSGPSMKQRVSAINKDDSTEDCGISERKTDKLDLEEVEIENSIISPAESDKSIPKSGDLLKLAEVKHEAVRRENEQVITIPESKDPGEARLSHFEFETVNLKEQEFLIKNDDTRENKRAEGVKQIEISYNEMSNSLQNDAEYQSLQQALEELVTIVSNTINVKSDVSINSKETDEGLEVFLVDRNLLASCENIQLKEIDVNKSEMVAKVSEKSRKADALTELANKHEETKGKQEVIITKISERTKNTENKEHIEIKNANEVPSSLIEVQQSQCGKKGIENAIYSINSILSFQNPDVSKDPLRGSDGGIKDFSDKREFFTDNQDSILKEPSCKKFETNKSKISSAVSKRPFDIEFLISQDEPKKQTDTFTGEKRFEGESKTETGVGLNEMSLLFPGVNVSTEINENKDKSVKNEGFEVVRDLLLQIEESSKTKVNERMKSNENKVKITRDDERPIVRDLRKQDQRSTTKVDENESSKQNKNKVKTTRNDGNVVVRDLRKYGAESTKTDESELSTGNKSKVKSRSEGCDLVIKLQNQVGDTRTEENGLTKANEYKLRNVKIGICDVVEDLWKRTGGNTKADENSKMVVNENEIRTAENDECGFDKDLQKEVDEGTNAIKNERRSSRRNKITIRKNEGCDDGKDLEQQFQKGTKYGRNKYTKKNEYKMKTIKNDGRDVVEELQQQTNEKELRTTEKDGFDIVKDLQEFDKGITAGKRRKSSDNRVARRNGEYDVRKCSQQQEQRDRRIFEIKLTKKDENKVNTRRKNATAVVRNSRKANEKITRAITERKRSLRSSKDFTNYFEKSVNETISRNGIEKSDATEMLKKYKEKQRQYAKKINLPKSIDKINIPESRDKINLPKSIDKINIPESRDKINLLESRDKINLLESRDKELSQFLCFPTKDREESSIECAESKSTCDVRSKLDYMSICHPPDEDHEHTKTLCPNCQLNDELNFISNLLETSQESTFPYMCYKVEAATQESLKSSDSNQSLIENGDIFQKNLRGGIELTLLEENDLWLLKSLNEGLPPFYNIQPTPSIFPRKIS